VRVPFLHRAVLQAGLALPDDRLVSWGRNKMALRSLARRHVPREVLHAPKMGFGPSQSRLLRSEQCEDLLFGERSRRRGLFDTEALASRWRSMRDGDERTAIQLYAPVAIEQWFRSFIDRSPVEATC
jgi:asparagine synthetase B (glutamine-hydrolysing)